MYYTLHHSKGSLILSADDRHQVLAWSERQLGKHAGLVSIIESEFDENGNLVEKTGTGISAEGKNGCRPLAVFSAVSAHNLPDVRKVTWH
jgi:hypothetical protein